MRHVKPAFFFSLFFCKEKKRKTPLEIKNAQTMSQSEETTHNNVTTEYVVLEIKEVNSKDRQEVAIGM